MYEAIVIGVSSGGITTLKKFFSLLPRSFRIPIIIVQHIGSRSENNWIHIMNQQLKCNIKEVDEKEKIEPGYIYVAPANYHLLISSSKTFSLTIEAKVNYARPSIDVLFESAAEVYGNKLIGIILSGSNNDGTKGLGSVKKHGGMTIVQNPTTAESPAMPSSALSVFPTYILSIEEIIPLLLKTNS